MDAHDPTINPQYVARRDRLVELMSTAAMSREQMRELRILTSYMAELGELEAAIESITPTRKP